MSEQHDLPDPRERAAETLAALEDPNHRYVKSSLRGLSGLTRRQFAELAERWTALPDAIRRRIVRDMVELAEDNVDLDFAEVLKRALLDADPEVRRTAIEGLWESEESQVAGELMRLAEGDPSDPVRSAAAGGLGRFAYLHELGRLDPALGEHVRETLTALFENEDEPLDVRRRAIEALSFISGETTHDLIVDAYRDDDPKMHASAIHAMGRSCDPAWVEVLLGELRSPLAEHRYEAARALGEMEDPAAVPELVKSLQDQDREVRVAAVGALGQIGGSQAKRALMQATTNPDEVLADAASAALDELNFGEDPIAFRLHRPHPSEN